MNQRQDGWSWRALRAGLLIAAAVIYAVSAGAAGIAAAERFGSDTQNQPTGNTLRITPLTEYPQWENAYRTALEHFYKDVLEGELDWLSTDLAITDYGYGFCDIDGNGTAELVTKVGNQVYEVYALADASPVIIGSGGYRFGEVMIGVSGLMWNWGSDSWAVSLGSYYRIAEDGFGRSLVWDIYCDEESGEYTVTDGSGAKSAMSKDEYLRWMAANTPHPGYTSAWRIPGEPTVNDGLYFRPVAAFATGTIPPDGRQAGGSLIEGYVSTLKAYRQAVLCADRHDAGDEGFEYTFSWEPLSDCVVFLGQEPLQDHFGYAFRHLNEDLWPELILMSKNHEIYAIFTLAGGNVMKCFWRSSNNPDSYRTCYLNPDNTFTITGSWSEGDNVGIYRLNEWTNTLERVTEVGSYLFHRSEQDFETRHYKMGDGGEGITISEAEAQDARSRLSSGANPTENARLSYIPLFEP